MKISLPGNNASPEQLTKKQFFENLQGGWVGKFYSLYQVSSMAD